MIAKAIVVLCAQALLLQSAYSQCIGPAGVDARFGVPYGLAGRGLGYDGLGYDAAWPARGLGLGCGVSAMEITPTSGGSLTVTSASAAPPVGVSIASENVYEGILAAAGELPFVGTVGVDGVVPTAGAGAVNYGCGNGVTAMKADVFVPAIDAFGPAIDAFGPAIDGFGAIDEFGPAIAPAAILAAPGPGYRASWAGNGCGYGL